MVLCNWYEWFAFWQIQGWHQCTAATYCLSQVSFLSRVGAVFKHCPQKVKINLTFKLEHKIFHFQHWKHNFSGSMFWNSSPNYPVKETVEKTSFILFLHLLHCVYDATPFIFVLFIIWSYFVKGPNMYANYSPTKENNTASRMQNIKTFNVVSQRFNPEDPKHT